MSPRRLLKFVVSTVATSIVTADEPRFLAVGWQEDQIVVWCEATPADPGGGVRATLAAFPTGAHVPPNAAYIGTAQHPTLNYGGPMVMHVYRQLEDMPDA